MSSPVLTSVRPMAHSTATSMLVSDDEDATGTALRTPRARPDSPPGVELDPPVEAPPFSVPAPADPPAWLLAAALPAPVLPDAHPLVEPDRAGADPGGLPPEAIAEPWVRAWPPRVSAEEPP